MERLGKEMIKELSEKIMMEIENNPCIGIDCRSEKDCRDCEFNEIENCVILYRSAIAEKIIRDWLFDEIMSRKGVWTDRGRKNYGFGDRYSEGVYKGMTEACERLRRDLLGEE